MTIHRKSPSRIASRYRTLLSAILTVFFFVFSLPTRGTLSLGIPLVLLGEAFRVWASGYIDKNDRITREGPYSLSRNPLYVGNFLMGLGFIVGAGVPWMIGVFLVVFSVLYWFTIRYEEAFLKRAFPAEWEDYSRSVPRIFALGGCRSYRPGEWRWSQVRKHREVRNWLIILMMAFLLIVKGLIAKTLAL